MITIDGKRLVPLTVYVPADVVAHTVDVRPEAPPSTGPVSYSERFRTCVSRILIVEGGFTDDPADTGGLTNMGITHEVLAEWRGRPVTRADMLALTKDEAIAIYHARYWRPLECDLLPVPVDMCVFNRGVNSGIRSGAKALQIILNDLGAGITVDGDIGNETIDAVKRFPADEIAARYQAKYAADYRTFRTWSAHGRGWINRNNRVTKWTLEDIKMQPGKIDRLIGPVSLTGYKTVIGIIAYVVLYLAHSKGMVNDVDFSSYSTMIAGWSGIAFLAKLERLFGVLMTLANNLGGLGQLAETVSSYKPGEPKRDLYQ